MEYVHTGIFVCILWVMFVVLFFFKKKKQKHKVSIQHMQHSKQNKVFYNL